MHFFRSIKGQSMHSNSRNTKLEAKVGEVLFIEVIFEVIQMFEAMLPDPSNPGTKKLICSEVSDPSRMFGQCTSESF